MTDLNEVRKQWWHDRPLYISFVSCLCSRIEERLKVCGVFGEVTGRAKEADSLLKKLLLRKDVTYEGMSDKAGMRVVVRYRSEITEVEKALSPVFQIVKRDDKTADIEADRFRYQGLHLDVMLPEAEAEREGFLNLKAEIQIRTKPQNLWSDLNHELAYKTNLDVPTDIKHRLFILLALLEMADREFEAVNRDLSALPSAKSLRLLLAVEKQFYKINPVAYSRELSLAVIDALSPLYNMNEILFASHIEQFYSERTEELDVVFREAKERSVFMSQPEVLIVFDLLERVPFKLSELWNASLPPSELEELARIWGKPIH
jgi:ppGpp synthetase/RelA/SpoT-type nucleotidyltranferase